MPVYPVPGSEKFSYRPSSSARVREIASPHVRLHDVDENAVGELDALTYEVVRHSLESITDEMGQAIVRMSGSLAITDANDFNFAILDEVGETVQIGLYNTQLSACSDMAVKWTLENRAENPGIRPGDMFLCNDPWIGGGMHQNDVSLFAPLFVDDELFAWTAAVAHQVDLGGVSPGSWTVKSSDVFWESLPTPPVKIVENGTLRADVEDVWLRRCRIPALVALDLRAKIGANRMAQERLTALVDKYGARTVKAVMRRMLDDAERRLRTKLADIPDGEWTSVAYQESAREGDDGLYTIRLRMTKTGDKMVLDFTGTDPQADGLINCTYSGLRGGVMPVLLSTLCGDLPWSPGGIYRCFEIISEPGSVNDATFPAGVSKASVASAFARMNAVTECISGMLGTHEEHKINAMSVCVGGWDLAVLQGLDQRGTPFVGIVSDPMAGGFGAQPHADGVDTGGLACIPMGRVPDVEMTEFAYPIMYLWRREETDSGGPGRFRGGLGGSTAFVVHDSPIAGVGLVVSGGGKAIPQSSGLAGGYPANTQYDAAIRNSNIREIFGAGKMVGDLDEIEGEFDHMPPHIETALGANDVYFMAWQGGGGYGDPVGREPRAVAKDAHAGKISVAAAADIYGVSLTDDGKVNEAATTELRDSIRRSRASEAVETRANG